uniref:Laminin subunit alpha-2 n=1 Tax=Panagrolaimus sp. JU765 TaxID=591449 RepID=A0AC34QSC3_9BILA
MNGVEVCDCPENFAGNSCEKCVAGYRRVNNQLYGGRCEKCNCEGHSDACDPFTGNCLDCKHNTTGPRCEQCLPGHYGNPLLGDELGSCKPCACPNIENNHSPQCTLSQLVLEDAARANQDEYVCTACEQGYDGNKCEICADGYFGDPATGTCQQCSCNGNIDLAAIGNCDRVTGECLRCIGHTTGESCERCEDNHWGSALDKTCKPCGCHHVGSTSLQCSNSTGLCDCHENYIGDRCDSCKPGHGDIEANCPECDCDQVGSIGTSCNQISGQCNCKAGIYGKRCDMCFPGYFNFTDQGCSFCHCDEYGSVDQKCSNTTGECECRENVEGTRCDHCVPGYFNITSKLGCQECSCNEIGSTSKECNAISGKCVCKEGVTGLKCDKCEPNHWGFDENGCKQCQKCPAPGQVCDPENGECVCPPNTIGDKCENCTKNSWNYDQYRGCELCDCDGIGSDSSECNPSTGQCKCKSGFVGHKCDHCQAGYFNFPNCEPCNCDLNGTDPLECRDDTCLCSNDGQCKCKQHVTGLKCDQCDSNSFSLDKYNPKGCTECFCFNRTNFCVQNSMVWQQLYTSDRRIIFEEPFIEFDRKMNLQILKEYPNNYNSYLSNHAPLYWPLPRTFLGDRINSYNGYLRFKIWNEDNYRKQHGIKPELNTFKLFPQVLLIGNDRIILENVADEVSEDNKYKVKLHETKWKNKMSPQIPVTRQQMMVVLQNLQAVYIRGTYNHMYRGDAISLRDVSMDIAVENVTDSESTVAIGVELCADCPEGYSGSSCQNPANGYCRKKIPGYLNSPDDLALIGYSTPCACNGHSTTCDPETCRCTDCQHNTMGDFCEICKPGYHGDAKEGSIDSCVKCACPLATNSFSDTCIAAETGRGYACDACKPGYSVLLIGNDRIILENVADEISEDNKYKVKLHETKWKNKMSPQIPVTRQQMMVVLQNLQAVYIRGTYNHMYRGDAISLRDVSMDIAVENVTDSESTVAIGVELCADCPEGYSGSSCQNPANGYCRKKIPGYLNSPDDLALIGYSTPCACNGHSTTCDPETCRCTDCQHNTMGDFCEICKPGYHGDAKEGSIDSCVKCACPLATNSFSDTCIAAETGRGYACDACKPGYSGLYCETCIPGYFGDPNTEGGYCQQCNCHPHGSLSPYCHNVTGQCECREGVDKRDCSGCRPRHAFISRVCTSCDQGCYKDLMIMEDEMETKLLTVQNLSDSKPIPKKRLRKINEAISSYDEILNNIKINENSATYLPNIEEDNKLIKEALFVIEEASVLDEKTNETLNKLNKLQNDIQKIRKIGHDQNQRVIDISTTLNKFSTEISQQIPANVENPNVENRVEEAERILENLREKEKQLEKQLNYVSKNSEDATVLLKEVLSKKLNDTSYDLLFEQHEERRKLIKDFRDTIWDEGKTNSTMAKKLTKLVNDRLEELKNLVDEIEKNVAEKENDLSKTNELIETIKQIMLDSHDNYQEINNNLSGDLQKKVDDLKTMTEKNVEEMRKDKSKLHKAQQHAKEMEHKAKRLKNQIADTNQFSNNALAATNSYKDIVESLVNASVAANEAKTASEDAFNEI